MDTEDFIKVRRASPSDGSCMGCNNKFFSVYKFLLGMFEARLCSACWHKLEHGFLLALKS